MPGVIRINSLLSLLLVGCVLAVAGGARALAKPVQTDHVEAELVAERTAVEPGKPLRVGLRLKMDPEWHTYWRNPGDTGLPTTIAWTLPVGFTPGDIEWPAPHRIDVSTFANYGYENEIVLPVTIQVPAALAIDAAVPIRAKAEWLVCREQCIPGDANLELELKAAATSEADARWGGLFAKAKADLPRAAGDWQWIAHQGQGATSVQAAAAAPAAATGEGRLDLVWTPPAGAATPTKIQFFAHGEGLVEPAAKQTLYRLPDGRLRLNLQLAKTATTIPAALEGVLTASNGWSAGGESNVRAIYVKASVDGRPLAAGGTPVDSGVTFASGAQSAASTLGFALVLALAGGLILNLMPCVFPVISLKVLGFAQQAHGHQRVLRAHGLVFAFGVIASFMVLAGIVLALRASGQQLGWGFQLQSPPVVAALAILFFLLTLNIAGVFEVGMLVPGRVATMEASNPYVNSFLSGVLAVVVASPCTAPFMGASLGYALSQPASEALLVFAALGLGMALPYLLLAWFPALIRKLPKPGPWMLWLKQFLSIPLAATVIWLGWVLSLQSGADAFARLMFVLLLIATIVWLLRGTLLRSGFRFALAAIVLASAVFLAWPLFDEPPAVAATPTASSSTGEVGSWQPWSQQELDRLVDAGKPVFVDFTAAWCVSCQANKKLVLERPETAKLFDDKGVVLMRADWTRRDPAITAALQGFGRNGVPVYALYRPGKTTLVLPEILTAGILRDAVHAL
jgi:thiol:disulfide interchange protein DsbD